jgi:hypothetical protein
MTSKPRRSFTARRQAALDELQSTIQQLFPGASFQTGRDPENPRGVHLVVAVDLDDPWDVLDAVIDRVVDFHVEGLPVHVIPTHTPERREALRRQGDVQRARGEVPVA